MKKIAFFACALVVSFTLTSCQTLQTISKNEQVGQIIQAILTNYISMQGTTYNCTGTGSAALWKNKGTQTAPNFLAGENQSSNMTITAVFSQTAAQLTLPALTVEGAKMEGVALGALTYANNTITVGDNTTAAGTLTVNGTAYPVAGAYLNNCTFSNNKLAAGTVQIYFGANYEYLINLSFTGNAVAAK